MVLPFLMPAPVMVDSRRSLMKVLRDLSLTTNLQFVIDAGDLNSWSGSGQTLGVLPSGGLTVNRGNSNSVEAANDPAFNGVVGRQGVNEFWQFDTVTATSAMRFTTTGDEFASAHKTNGKVTLAGVFILSATSSGVGGQLFDSSVAAATNVGMNFFYGTSNKLGLSVANGTGTYSLLSASSAASVTFGSRIFLAMSYDAATGVLIFQINGAQETITGQSLTSPSAAASTRGQLAIYGGAGTATITYTSYMHKCAAWLRALSAAEINQLYASLRAYV